MDSSTLKEVTLSTQERADDSRDPSATPSSTLSGGGLFKKRAKTGSTAKFLRKQVTVATVTVSDDESEEDEESDDGKGGRASDVLAGRKRKRGGLVQASTSRTTNKEDLGVSYSAGSENILDPKSQATAISAEFTDAELLGKTKSSAATDSAADNLYRGQKGYRSLVPKREQITTKYNSMGPQKAASNIRMTTVTDYAPDICKDYKLTGYCGFGDNCKFLHDRGDYKAGWQIDRDWEIEQAKKNDTLAVAAEESDTDDDMDNVPFVCLICREDYEDPVVTKCGHYFCMTCAIKRYKKTPNCLVCGTGTMGIFNRAKDFEKKLEAKRKRQEEKERRRQGLENEGEGEDEETVDQGGFVEAEVDVE